MDNFGVQLVQIAATLITALAALLALGGLLLLAAQRGAFGRSAMVGRLRVQPALIPIRERRVRVRREAGSIENLPTRAPPTMYTRDRGSRSGPDSLE
jgi:hypothetical protein